MFTGVWEKESLPRAKIWGRGDKGRRKKKNLQTLSKLLVKLGLFISFLIMSKLDFYFKDDVFSLNSFRLNFNEVESGERKSSRSLVIIVAFHVFIS